MKEFGQSCYESYVYFNFDEEDELKSIFEVKVNLLGKQPSVIHLVTTKNWAKSGLVVSDYIKTIPKEKARKTTIFRAF